jgi:uncharacterized protein (DUF849 family)
MIRPMHGGYKKIRAARVRAARRKLARRRARWGDAVIIRGSGNGGGVQLTAPQRTRMTASQLWRKHG